MGEEVSNEPELSRATKAMYKAYCNHCGNDWENNSPNCPHCGTPNPEAESTDGGGRTRKRKSAPMNDNESTSTFSKAAAEAVKQGALMATAGEANNMIKAGVMKGLLAAGMTPEALEGAIFQKGMPLMSATLLLFLAERFPDMIPQSKHVARAAQLALTQASAESLEPLLKAAAPTLMALASSGKKIAELEGELYADEEEEEVDEVEDAEYEETIDVTPQEPEVTRSGPRGVPTSQAAPRRS